MKNNALQLFVALAVLVLALVVLNPLHLFMPTMLAMLALAALFVLFCIYAVFVLAERSFDEREAQHRALAGRAAFLAGSALLVAGIVVEDLSHTLDSWLVVALAGMILAKVVTRIYSEREF